MSLNGNTTTIPLFLGHKVCSQPVCHGEIGQAGQWYEYWSEAKWNRIGRDWN
jgi:hypothetical protein